jgi:hypothetical protein
VGEEKKKGGETVWCFGHWWQFSVVQSRTLFVRKRILPVFVIGVSSHPSFHQFASMHAFIIPPSTATIMPMSCPQQKHGLGIRRIMSIVLLVCVVMWNIGTLSQLVVPHPQFADSEFLRASSEPIVIMKSHPPQPPFKKVHFLEKQQLRMNDYFSATWIQPTARQVLTS